MDLKGFGFPDFQPTPRGYLPIRRGLEVSKANLRNLLSTSKRERVNMPDYGTDLEKKLFRLNVPALHQEIEQEISEAIRNWDATIVVHDIRVYQPDSSEVEPGEDPERVIRAKVVFSSKDDLSTKESLDLMFKAT